MGWGSLILLPNAQIPPHSVVAVFAICAADSPSDSFLRNRLVRQWIIVYRRALVANEQKESYNDPQDPALVPRKRYPKIGVHKMNKYRLVPIRMFANS